MLACWLPLISILKAVQGDIEKEQGKSHLYLARLLHTLFHVAFGAHNLLRT